MSARRVPVIALTGHLGAGKTTLLNHLLRQPGARIGVVVNDFGDINIDAGLVSGQVDQIGSIAGGCLCCLDDISGLDDALERLTHPRLGLDAVIIEASGLAEPGALAFMIRYSGVERVRPGGLIEVVDAVNYFETIDGGGMAPARFSSATLVVINKCDQLPSDRREERLAAIEARVREADPDVTIVHTSRGAIDPTLAFDVATSEDPEDELPLASLQREAHDHRHHVHAASASATAIRPVDPGAVVDLLDDPPEGAYRLKGTVTVDTGRRLRRYVVHVVGRHRHVLGMPGDATTSELVAIGVGLDPAAVQPRLEAALRPAEQRNPEGLRRLQRIRRLSE